MNQIRHFSAVKGSSVYQKLKPGPLKKLYKYYTPSAVNLAGGVPMDSIFPIESIAVSTTAKTQFEIKRCANTANSTLSLNYHRGDGIPWLKDWIHSHVSTIHCRHPSDFASCVSVGSTDAFSKVLTLLNGDSVLFDRYAYGAAVSSARVLGRNTIGVSTDKYGMIPSDLRSQTLAARNQGLNPDLVYVVPVANNPTGNTMPEERKIELYEVCNELDLVIVEDDAYYYIHFGEEGQALPGIESLPRSIFSHDRSGRVIRLDSLSKFIAPGMRLGWVSAPADFIDKYLLLQEMTSQFPSGLSQSVTRGLLQHWGHDGLNTHCKQMQDHYRRQCKQMIQCLKESFPPGIIEYNIPTGGMFVWVRLVDEKFRGVTSEELFIKLAAIGVITVPGHDFRVPGLPIRHVVDPALDLEFPQIRLSYAAPSLDNIQEGVRRLAQGILDFKK